MGKPVRLTFDKRPGEKNVSVRLHIGRDGVPALNRRGALTQMGTGHFWDMLLMSQKCPVPIWVFGRILAPGQPKWA